MEENKKSKKKGFLISALIILVIGLALIFVGVKVLSKPKMIFKQSLTYLVKSVRNLETENDLIKLFESYDKVKYSSDINIKLNESLDLGISNLDLKLEVLENKTEKTSKYYIDSKLDNQRLLEVISYLKDNKLHFTITDILDKYYYTDMEYVSFFENISTEDLDLIIKQFTDSVNEVLTDEKFVKEDLNAEVDGKYEDLTRLSLKVDDALLSEILTKTINKIKNNEDVLNAFVNISAQEKTEVVATLDETLQELNDVTGEVLFTYNIYYKNINDIRKLELISGDEIITYTGNNNTYKLKYDEVNTNIFTLLVTADKNNNYSISLNAEDINIQGNVTKNNNIYYMNFNFKDDANNDLGSLLINSVEESSLQNEMAITYRIENKDIITVTMTSKYSFGENISIPDLTTSKDFEQMTEDEMMAIMTNLSNHSIFGSLLQLYGSSI